ncbi:MAG: hypothetical protein DMD65_09655 [Gemmatimonadetes bacterium]|nr:MAG: hypothetical protein DMD65_09655 [Gemmatimonadota bacterium]
MVAATTLCCSDTSAPTRAAAPRTALVASSAASAPTLTPQQSGTTNRLQAISPVSPRVAWASGVGGTYVVTTDGGATWRAGVVPGAEGLQFRDVEGVSETDAYLMSAGSGTASRIYKTEDGGASWSLQFQNQDPDAFYDCFAFWSPKHGLTMSDAVNGRFPVIRTLDGVTWQDIGDRLPVAQSGEAAFAASGTCITAQGGKRAWIATGAAAQARILATTDGGETWAAYDTPIVQGTPSSGGLSVDFRDPLHGILGGGELAAPGAFADDVARSSDGGKTWRLTSRVPFTGAVFGLSYVRGLAQTTVVATGPGGAAWSPDEGDTWFSLPGVANYWAVAFASPQAGWLVGTQGRILKVSF